MERLSRAGGSRKVPVRYAVPRAGSWLLAAAVRAHRKGRPAEALEKYEQRLLEEPACLDAWMNLGALQARAGRAKEAAEAFRRAAELAPSDGRVFRDIGVGLQTIGRLEEAAAALERSVECEPALIGSWLHLARTRLESTARPLAIAAAERAVQLNPADASAALVLARCVFDGAAPRAALDALERAEGLPEAQIFHRLIEWHTIKRHSDEGRRIKRHSDEGRRVERHSDEGDGPVTKLARSEGRFLEGLQSLLSAFPALRDLAEAAAYVHSEMAGAQLFSSARDTLRFAASVAPTAGSVVELGVFHGVSLRWLVDCRPQGVHGFDSFAGLPDSWERVPEGRFTTAGRIPEGIDVQFWVGPFEEQLPRFVAQHREPIALLHVDSDLYESARSGLAHLGGLLKPGSVLVFDEYLGQRNWRQDEFRAFQEAVATYGWRYEYLAANPFTGQAVVRLLDAPQG